MNLSRFSPQSLPGRVSHGFDDYSVAVYSPRNLSPPPYGGIGERKGETGKPPLGSGSWVRPDPGGPPSLSPGEYLPEKEIPEPPRKEYEATGTPKSARRTVLGVDPGLARCGWAELDLVGRVVRCGCLRTRAAASEVGDEQRRLVEVTRGLRDIVANASRVVIEWPSSGGFGRGPDKGNAKSASQTGKVAAMVYGLAVAYGRPCTLPAPVTWRTALGARRGADGELHAVIAVRHEEALVGVRAADLPHVLDAIGLAEYRLQLGTNNSERRR